MYHILSRRFPLVSVSGQDEEDLKEFCAREDSETAQRWLNRLCWPQGLAKIVSFGVGLKMDGKVKGVWCYYAALNDTSATYQGITMTWERWAAPLIECLGKARAARVGLREASEEAMMLLYYQDGYYMTLPQAERNMIVTWIYEYLKRGPRPFPLHGDTGSEVYSFTIDFEKDCEIVRSYDLKKEMADYNREHNQEKAARRVAKRFADLQGDRWRTAEMLAQGFSPANIRTFRKNGLIKQVYQGLYVRVSK